MNVSANRAVWLVVLGALAASGIRPRTDQLPAGPAQVTPSNDVTLRVIVVDSAEKAQGIVARLNGGENFVAVAQAESIDPTGGTGGLLGKVARSTLPPVLKDALVGVGPGQLSPVVQIPTGFAILKVVEDMRFRRLGDVRDRLRHHQRPVRRQQLRQQRRLHLPGPEDDLRRSAGLLG
jgi:peptidyl-prolyl cis-trans isomerase C